MYEAALKYGDAEPLPWWLDDLVQAEIWHIPPWKLHERNTSRAFWRECGAILRSARYQVQRKQQQKSD